MLTYALTCAFVLLLAVYNLILKQKSFIRTILKYRDLNLVTLIDAVGSEVTNHLPKHKQEQKYAAVSQSATQERTNKLVKPKDIYQMPGPAIIPIIGTRWQFYYRYSLPMLHEAYADMHKRYGDIILEVGNGHPYIHLFNRTDIEKVLRCNPRYPFRPPVDIMVEYRKTRPDRYAPSGGIVLGQGEVWHNLRTNLTAGLSSVMVLNNFLPKLEQITDEFMDLIRRRRDENGVIEDFRAVISHFSLEAIAELILGKRLGLLEPSPSMDILELAKAIQEMFQTFRDVFYGSSLWKYLPSKTWDNYVKNEDLIYSKISDIVDKSIGASGNGHEDPEDTYNDGESTKTIYEQILSSNLEMREKKSGLIDLMTSGIETLTTTLSIMLYYLSENPECQRKILEELATGIEREELLNATYLKACVQESYRKNPASFLLARLQEEDIELSGYQVKAGTLVLCHTMIASNQEENFSQAKSFIPERWIPSSSFWSDSTEQKRPNHTPAIVLPFGSGRRVCPGKRITQLEMLMVVSKLVQNFEIEYLGEMDLKSDFLLGPRNVNVRFRDRVPV